MPRLQKVLSFYHIRSRLTKRVINILIRCIWSLLILYAAILLAVQIPSVQRWIGGRMAGMMADALQTRVNVGSVDVGLLNRIVMHDVQIYDQQDKKLLTAPRINGKVEVMPLLNGKIRMSSVQLINPDIRLYRSHDNAKPNYQFILDALASKDDKEKKPTDISINAAVISNGKLRYDVLSCKRMVGGFDARHVKVDSLNAYLIVNSITDNKADVQLRNLSLVEQCGLHITDLSAHVYRLGDKWTLDKLSLQLPTTNLQTEKISLLAKPDGTKFDMQDLKGKLSPADVRCLIRQPLPFSTPVNVQTSLSVDNNTFHLQYLNIADDERKLLLSADGTIAKEGETTKADINISKLFAAKERMTEITQTLRQVHVTLPESLQQIGSVEAQGLLAYHGGQWKGEGSVRTDLGHIKGWVKHDGNNIVGDITANQLLAGRMISKENDLNVSGNIYFSANKGNTSLMPLTLRGSLQHIQYQHYDLHNVSFDGVLNKNRYEGKLAVDDTRGHVQLNGTLDFSNDKPQTHLTAQVKQLNSNLFSPVQRHRPSLVDFDMQADMAGNGLNNLVGNIRLANVHVRSAEKSYSISNVDISSSLNAEERRITLHSPVADANLQGQFELSSLTSSLERVLSNRLPAFIKTKRAGSVPTANNFKVYMQLYSTEWLRSLTGIDVETEAPVHIEGLVNERNNTIDMSANIPHIRYKGTTLAHTTFNINTIHDSLRLEAKTHRMTDSGQTWDIALDGLAYDSVCVSSLSFDNHSEKRPLKGSITSTVQLFRNEQGQRVTHLTLQPSTITFNNESWNVQPSDVVYQSGQLIVDHLAIRNGNQFVNVSGIATEDENSKINVEFQGVNVEMLSALLNVKGVTFSGLTHGTAQISSVFRSPKAHVLITIDDMEYTGTPLGQFVGWADWTAENNTLTLHGKCDEADGLSSTTVNGDIQLKPLTLNLNIGVNNTQTRFMETYLHNTIGRMDARATGGIRVFGPARHVDIEGAIVVNGDVMLEPLRTTYTLLNDSVLFFPGHIAFRSLQLTDERNKPLRMQGDVFHNYLKNWEYNLNLSGDNFCLLNRPNFEGNTACGKIFAEADIEVRGKKGQVDIDVSCTPLEGSIVQYNASQPESVHQREFIRWHDASLKPNDTQVLATAEQMPIVVASNNNAADVRMNLLLNATPDLTLRVVMDQETGDYIDLQGNGTLRANYFNKASFNIYGNYIVNQGLYRMTIQNMLSRPFTFQEGGNIVFTGNPYEAQLNLKAVHTVNGVSLADLQIGNSFKSNNIPVNCMMKLTGTPLAPQVDFDISMPTASNDAAQMVRSIINSQEELNQQVIYLLTIGRFYNPENNATAQNANAQSQTSLAMQSLLSGTLSQQLNNILTNVLHTNNNWSIGANISTGAEGWNNAQYEGLLSGRLLNNRLLINGQFGYRDNANATTSFIGDFDVRYLLMPNGNLAVRVYNQTNDRYFTRNSLNTQGVGLILKKDFNSITEFFRKRKSTSKQATDTLRQSADSVTHKPAQK